MNKKIIKPLSAALALGMAATSLAACNNNGIKKIDENALKDYTFRVSGYVNFSDDPLNMGYADGANEFLKRYPEAKIEYITVDDNDTQSIASAIAAGDVWDLQYVFTCTRFPGDIVDGLYEPLDGYFDPEDERLDAGALKNGFFDGHYYGVSNSTMNEVNYMSYNENVFKENGIKTPHEYYAEGNWNMDAFMEICKQFQEKGLKLNTNNFYRPDWILNRATKWNDDFTEVEIILDSNQTRQDLDKFRTILYDMDIATKQGIVSKREVALSTEVIPNIVKSNNTTETTDTIRYIYLPNSDKELSGPHCFFTDAAFCSPAGSNLDVKSAAVELAICMGQGRKTYLDGYYRDMMCDEDYEILQNALSNGKPLARAFSEFPFYKFRFGDEMLTGKSVSTYVSELKTQLETYAGVFNEKIAQYREDTGLSAEK